MGPKLVLASPLVKKKSIQLLYLPLRGQTKSIRWYNVHIIGCPSTLQNTAANSYGVEEERVSENLVKINVYYTSLNEKSIEDKIDYSLQVRWLKSRQI